MRTAVPRLDAEPCAPKNESEAASRESDLELVFRRHADRVYKLARRMTGSDADAEDIMQDVFLQVVRKLDTFRGDAELTTWLHRVTVNAVLLLRRRKSRRPERPLLSCTEGRLEANRRIPQRAEPTSPQRQTIVREIRQIIDGAIAGLPPLYREVYVLADVEECSNATIGRQLNLSLAAVKSRLHRARSSMRTALSPRLGESVD